MHVVNQTVEAANRDTGRFLYLRDRDRPRHYLATLVLVLKRVVAAVLWVLRPSGRGRGSSLPGLRLHAAGDQGVIQFALLWGSTWVGASLALAAGAAWRWCRRSSCRGWRSAPGRGGGAGGPC